VTAAPRRFALLAYLAVEAPGTLQRRDTLAALFWPESPQEAARHSLRTLLHLLRKTLPGVIVTRGHEEVGVDAARLYCDAVELERAAAAGRHEEALELYRGEFLAGFHLRDAPEFAAWADGVRARLAERAVEAASRLARGAPGEAAAVAWARRAVELSRGGEPQVRLLMEALSAAGDAAGALREYEALARTLREEYGVRPSPETEAQLQWLLETGAADADAGEGERPARRAHNLPSPATPLVGREREADAAAARLAESRLVTILGPGGVGKSRLAVEVAWRRVEAYRDGAWFVPLAGLSAGEHLPGAIGAALRVPAALGTPARPRLLDYLREKEMLLVLDSFEHLAAEGRFATELLEAAPGVRLLVTSRERLGLPAETLVELWGMEVPDDDGADERWRDAEAVRLFAQAARRFDPAFTVADEDLPGVARICRFAGGFPLGIELAAAWVRLLSTREIAAALDEGSEPTATGRAVPVRQRSLRAAFEHSWGLLSARERAVLALLSVFRGSFGLAAGTAVAAATLPNLTELADRSLLRRAGPAYFEVPEVLRRYAEEKLREHPAEHARAVKRQTIYHLGLLADAEAELASIDEHVAAARLQPEIDHVRAAWKRAAADRAHALLADAARGYFLFLDLLGWCEEGYAAFAEAADALAGEPATAAAARECELYLGVFALRLGYLAEAEARLSRVLADFERLGEEARAAFAGHRLGTTLLELGRVDEAQERYERSMRRYRALGDHRAAANSLTHLGNIAYSQDRLDDARRLHEEGIAIQRRIGDRRLLALSLNNLGGVLTAQGRLDEAERRYHEGLRLAASTRDPGSSVRLLHNLAYIGRAVGDLSAAAAFAERSLELSRRMGFRLVQAATLVLLGGITQDAGDHAGAEERYRAGMALLDGSGAAPLLLDAAVSLAELERARGNVEKARVLAAEALESPAVEPQVRARAASLIQSLA